MSNRNLLTIFTAVEVLGIAVYTFAICRHVDIAMRAGALIMTVGLLFATTIKVDWNHLGEIQPYAVNILMMAFAGVGVFLGFTFPAFWLAVLLPLYFIFQSANTARLTATDLAVLFIIVLNIVSCLAYIGCANGHLASFVTTASGRQSCGQLIIDQARWDWHNASDQTAWNFHGVFLGCFGVCASVAAASALYVLQTAGSTSCCKRFRPVPTPRIPLSASEAMIRSGWIVVLAPSVEYTYLGVLTHNNFDLAVGATLLATLAAVCLWRDCIYGCVSSAPACGGQRPRQQDVDAGVGTTGHSYGSAACPDSPKDRAKSQLVTSLLAAPGKESAVEETLNPAGVATSI